MYCYIYSANIQIMKKLSLFLVVCVFALSCKKEEGCTNPKAINYNSKAEVDDGSCTAEYEGIYFVKDSIFYNGDFFENKTYYLEIDFLSALDSIVIKDMPGVSTTKDVFAELTGTNFIIPQQPFDPNADATGTGEFDFGVLRFELNYGVVKHSCVGTKN